MCGIAGYVGKIPNPSNHLNNMVQAIDHRGPDNRGMWVDEDKGIGLGHARLSILDLSPAGHQPMHSASDNFVIIFNGEIYNHRFIRSELDALNKRRWIGTSDTEILLAAIDQWGFEETLKKVKGMFAIALWDKKRQHLSLVIEWAKSQFIMDGSIIILYLPQN